MPPTLQLGGRTRRRAGHSTEYKAEGGGGDREMGLKNEMAAEALLLGIYDVGVLRKAFYVWRNFAER